MNDHKGFLFHPIGIIHSPFQDPEGVPIQPGAARGTRGQVVLDTDYVPGLKDLEGFSHLILIYCFHRAQGYQLLVRPFLDETNRGLFATRAPRRPNPIGVSVVKLISISGETCEVEDLDVLDGTPLLDIKPFVPDFDAPGDVRIGWLEDKRGQIKGKLSDQRFSSTEK